jgi:hypothetical protein
MFCQRRATLLASFAESYLTADADLAPGAWARDPVLAATDAATAARAAVICLRLDLRLPASAPCPLAAWGITEADLTAAMDRALARLRAA